MLSLLDLLLVISFDWVTFLSNLASANTDWAKHNGGKKISIFCDLVIYSQQLWFVSDFHTAVHLDAGSSGNEICLSAASLSLPGRDYVYFYNSCRLHVGRALPAPAVSLRRNYDESLFWFDWLISWPHWLAALRTTISIVPHCTLQTQSSVIIYSPAACP